MLVCANRRQVVFLDKGFSNLLRQLRAAFSLENTDFDILLYQSLEVHLKSNFYCWKC